MDRQIVIKNLLISYTQTAGLGDKTVLFLHGWRSDKQVWAGVIRKLGNWEIRKFSIYAMDLPGFGKSQAPNSHPSPLSNGVGAWGVGDYADVVAEFIKKMELKDVIIVAHSFGGRVGIKLSSAHPELIGKLVLVDSAGFAMASAKKNLIKTAAKIVKPFFKPKFTQPLRRKIYRAIGAEDYLATPELQKTFVNITGEDLSSDMEKIVSPTLIIWGENDQETPLESGRNMQLLIPNSKLLILKNAGHFSFLNQPEEFVKILQKFLWPKT